MKQSRKSIWALAVLCAILAVLAGCGAQPGAQQTPEAQVESAALQVDTAGVPAGQCYRQTPYLNPAGISSPEGQCVWKARVCSICNAPAGLAVMDANGSSQSFVLPESAYLYAVCDGEAQLALLAGGSPFFAEADGEAPAQSFAEGEYAIFRYSETGALTEEIPLQTRYPDTPYALEQGGADYYLLFVDAVVRVGADGRELARSGELGGRLLQLLFCDGAVYVRVEGDSIYQTEKVVRLNAGTLQPEAELPCAALKIQGMGRAADGALLLSSRDYLLRPDFSAGTVRAVLSWADNANTATNNYPCVLETEQGFFAYGSEAEVACFYEKLPEGETLEEPTVITLFADHNGLEANMALAADVFQKLYPQYRIDITAAETDAERELARLELGVGKGYDIYVMDFSAWAQLRGASFFEDLTRWMASDASKPLERIRPSVLRQMQEDGGIYRLPLSYSVLTYAADPEQLPDCRPETILQACGQAEEERYPFARIMDYSGLMAEHCAQEFVDEQQGTCNFQCEAFYAQLALLRRQQPTLQLLPDGVDPVALPRDGLLYYYLIAKASNITYHPGNYCYPELKQSVYYSYPGESEGGCNLVLDTQLAINARSEQKAGAWAFLSYLLSDSYQQTSNYVYLPVSDTALQAQFAQLLAEEAITQEDIDTFYGLVDHAQTSGALTQAIEQIIQEETSAYLAGAVDEKTTAERIQSRAYLCIQEQRVD